MTSLTFKGEQIMVLGRGHYLVRSWTEPAEWHSVDTEELSCSCRGFECARYCRHLTTLKELERVQSVQNPSAG